MERLGLLAQVFSLEFCAYAVMPNHCVMAAASEQLSWLNEPLARLANAEEDKRGWIDAATKDRHFFAFLWCKSVSTGIH